MEQGLRGGLQFEDLIKETKNVLNTLKNHATVHPENAPIIWRALDILSNQLDSKDSEIQQTNKIPDEEEKKLIDEMTEKIQVYLPPRFTIREIRELGKQVSDKSKVPLPKIFQKKYYIYEWFKYNWDILFPVLEELKNTENYKQNEPAQSVEIKNESDSF